MTGFALDLAYGVGSKERHEEEEEGEEGKFLRVVRPTSSDEALTKHSPPAWRFGTMAVMHRPGYSKRSFVAAAAAAVDGSRGMGKDA